MGWWLLLGGVVVVVWRSDAGGEIDDNTIQQIKISISNNLPLHLASSNTIQTKSTLCCLYKTSSIIPPTWNVRHCFISLIPSYLIPMPTCETLILGNVDWLSCTTCIIRKTVVIIHKVRRFLQTFSIQPLIAKSLIHFTTQKYQLPSFHLLAYNMHQRD